MRLIPDMHIHIQNMRAKSVYFLCAKELVLTRWKKLCLHIIYEHYQIYYKYILKKYRTIKSVNSRKQLF